MTADSLAPDVRPGLRHEALLYAGEADFVAQTVPFVREGLARGEPTLVMVPGRRIDALWSALGSDAESLYFEDMTEVGANPALIIPAWRAFVAEHATTGRPLRGVGEPIWAGRAGVELVECALHERLLNLAFADADDFWLVCPYDTAALDPAVVGRAQTSHPVVGRGGVRGASPVFAPVDPTSALDEALPEPAAVRLELAFDAAGRDALDAVVAGEARRAGLDAERTVDLVSAVRELTGNSVRHGGGRGRLRGWIEEGRLVVEVADAGRVIDPLVGRERPDPDAGGGRGLRRVARLCDLLQLRSSAQGTVARVHIWLGGAIASGSRPPTRPG